MYVTRSHGSYEVPSAMCDLGKLGTSCLRMNWGVAGLLSIASPGISSPAQVLRSNVWTFIPDTPTI